MDDAFNCFGQVPSDCTIASLLAFARVARLKRLHRQGGRCLPSKMLEQQLTAKLPRTVNLAPFLSRILTLAQVMDPRLGQLRTHIVDVRVSRNFARAIAVAVSELLHYALSSLARDAEASVSFVGVVDRTRLILALSADGSLHPICSAEPTRALLRGASLIKRFGGEFERGIDGERMVFASVFKVSEVALLKNDLGERRSER